MILLNRFYEDILADISTELKGTIHQSICLKKSLTDFSLEKTHLNNDRKEKYGRNCDLYFERNGKQYTLKCADYKRKLNGQVFVCPYCGKIPFAKRASYSENAEEELYSFELDHFFEKSEHPSFALSVYNLVPVCKTCNQFVKKGQKRRSGKYFHPYLGWLKIKISEAGKIVDVRLEDADKGKSFHSEYVFGFPGAGKFWNIRSRGAVAFWDKRNPGISVEFDEHKNFLLLDNIYQHSIDTVTDYAIFLNCRDVMSSIDPAIRKIDAFKGWYPEDDDDILKYPNGKMRQDLVKSLD